mgnify:CR=1 FL=1
MNLKETYNKIAESWHKDHQSDDWWIKGTNKFADFLNNSGLVLDVGCGGGTKSKYLISKGLNVIGIDISEGMIDIAKKEVPQGEFMVMDLSEVNSLEEMFDGIFMQAVLLHIPKKDAQIILEKIVGKLKNSGYVYIAVKEKLPNGIDEEVKVDNDYGYEYKRFFSYYTIEELKSYLEFLGLDVVFEDNNPPSRTSRSSNWIQIIGKKP